MRPSARGAHERKNCEMVKPSQREALLIYLRQCLLEQRVIGLFLGHERLLPAAAWEKVSRLRTMEADADAAEAPPPPTAPTVRELSGEPSSAAFFGARRAK